LLIDTPTKQRKKKELIVSFINYQQLLALAAM